MSKLGDVVKELRQGKGLTQMAVCGHGGLALVARLEQGRCRYIVADQIDGLARGLGVDPAVLWDAIPPEGRTAKYIPLEAARG